jgi:branched-subunit amino acid ABC-type transport system permease component
VSDLFLYAVLSLPLIGAYALLGLGITVIYQASQVLNLAHGALAVGAAYTTYQLDRSGAPLVVSLLAGVVFAALLGLLVERFLVRRLRSAGPTAQTVGTVGVLLLSIAVFARIFGTEPVAPAEVFPQGAVQLPGGFIPYGQLGIFPVAIIAAGVLFALFRFTDIGLAMRGAAQNRRGAALRGVDPDATAALAWLLGGALAGVAGILLASGGSLTPYNLSLGVLPAFVAALIGGLESMPGVCIGAVVIGLVQGLVPFLASTPLVGVALEGQGSPELVLGIVALAVMALRGSRLSVGDVRGDQL